MLLAARSAIEKYEFVLACWSTVLVGFLSLLIIALWEVLVFSLVFISPGVEETGLCLSKIRSLQPHWVRSVEEGGDPVLPPAKP